MDDVVVARLKYYKVDVLTKCCEIQCHMPVTTSFQFRILQEKMQMMYICSIRTAHGSTSEPTPCAFWTRVKMT